LLLEGVLGRDAGPGDAMHTTLEPPSVSDLAPTPLPIWRTVLFRFGFVYWMLIVLVVAANEDVGITSFGKVIGPVWNPIVVWVARHVLRISYELHPGVNGSGDKTSDWVGVFLAAATAIIASVVWSIVDRRGAQDVRLRALLRVVLRYTLAFALLGYGLSKLFGLQFSTPSANRLVQQYGDSSPMGLLWTFMGASRVYATFAGAAETLGAVLLLFRRTTALGALTLAVVLLNVVLMNFCYDVPVKINAAHYLVMCICLLTPELRRLADVLVFNRPTQAVPRPALALSRRLRVARWVVKYGLIGFMVHHEVQTDLRWLGFGDTSAWYSGYWNVTGFVRDGQDVPALITDATRWRRIRIQGARDPVYARWRFMDDSYGDLYRVAVDEKQQAMTLTPMEIDSAKSVTGPVTFHYVLTDPDHVTLEGKVGAASLSVRLERFDARNMLLVNRGFHWINETPFNR
jgi:uncharacterized membrane protein YphA (DoxX/SURF4 family)